jgi:hypothetical protein
VVARKFRTYRTWIEMPEIARQTFGFAAFHVVVTVSGERAERRIDSSRGSRVRRAWRASRTSSSPLPKLSPHCQPYPPPRWTSRIAVSARPAYR